jgi:hypothetical protein
LYYPDSPILIKIEIINNSADTVRFELADNRIFNINFEVRTLSNKMLAQSEKLTIERHSNQQVFFREISLAPMEQFSFYENLRDYVEITAPGAYILEATFYPDLITPGISSTMYRSNRLNLSIRPQEKDLMLPVYEDAVQMARLQKKNLPPDEVVAWTIQSRQQNMWDEFFLYLDIESLLMNDQARERRFLRLSEEEQDRMTSEYRESLKNEEVDGDIVVIPQEFEIIKTEYTPEEATVKVIEKFQYPGYKEVKEYTYFLKKRDNVWFIYDYEVRNLGTE